MTSNKGLCELEDCFCDPRFYYIPNFRTLSTPVRYGLIEDAFAHLRVLRYGCIVFDVRWVISSDISVLRPKLFNGRLLASINI